MEFDCKKISVTDSGIGAEIHFQNLNGDNELYFLIQRHFDEYDNSSYIESHIDDLIGHFRPKIKLSKTKCEFEYDKKQVTINYQISEKKFEEMKEVINALGTVEIKK